MKWKGADFDKTCGDCIHADICEHNLSPEFSRENIAWCNSFKDKTDVVEVVRCKDCVYYEIHKPRVLENCERNNRLIPMNPNDFCSYGEKRKDGAE